MNLSIKDEYLEKGFVILRNFFPNDILSNYENTVVTLYYQQCLKLPEFHEFIGGGELLSFQSVSDFDLLLGFMEEFDKETLYQVLPMVANSIASKQFSCYRPFAEVCSDLFGCTLNQLITIGPEPFIKIPKQKRLVYHWHSEAHYYPKRCRLINVWFPIFRSKHADNGTMYMAVGSHKKFYSDFASYQGYDKETFNSANHFLQFEIPESDVGEFEKVAIEAQRGDVVLFDRNLIHSGSVNLSSEISYNAVMRVFDYREDLTLTGYPVVKPTTDYARPGMRRLPIVQPKIK